MFGYVRPAPDKLTPEEQAQYRALYCGLCHTLGERYGPAGRMTLNYDFTFLAALLSAGTETGERRCIASPVKRRTAVRPDGALALAADCGVILTYWKLCDAVADHRSVKRQGYRALRRAMRGAYRRAAALRPAFDESARRELERLSGLEARRCPTLDEPADAFASLLRGIAGEVDDPVGRRVLSQLLYHLGRWIYLVDALDDLEDDAKTGNYNPVALRFGLDGGALTDEARRAVGSTLDASIRQMAAAYELWDFGPWGALIRSVVYQGLYCVGGAVLDGTYHTGGRR